MTDNIGARGIEVLKFQLPYWATIDGVRPLGAKFFNVKQVRTATNLFVRRETNADVAVFDVWIRFQVSNCTDDFSDARFVVGTK